MPCVVLRAAPAGQTSDRPLPFTRDTPEALGYRYQTAAASQVTASLADGLIDRDLGLHSCELLQCCTSTLAAPGKPPHSCQPQGGTAF